VSLLGSFGGRNVLLLSGRRVGLVAAAAVGDVVVGGGVVGQEKF